MLLEVRIWLSLDEEFEWLHACVLKKDKTVLQSESLLELVTVNSQQFNLSFLKLRSEDNEFEMLFKEIAWQEQEIEDKQVQIRKNMRMWAMKIWMNKSGTRYVLERGQVDR